MTYHNFSSRLRQRTNPHVDEPQGWAKFPYKHYRASTPLIRCDALQYINSGVKGCVFNGKEPVFRLKASDNVDEAAEHIRWAQRNLPLHPGSTRQNWDIGVPYSIPMTRNIDPATADKNRRAACRKFENEYPKRNDCDEYPFASTEQGCWKIHHPPTVLRCSVREIHKDHNQKVGRILGTFYRKMRVARGDNFRVDADY